MKDRIIAEAKAIYTLDTIRTRREYVISFFKLWIASQVVGLPLMLLSAIPFLNLLAFPMLVISYGIFGAGMFCLAYTRLAELNGSKNWAVLQFIPIAAFIQFLVLAFTVKKADDTPVTPETPATPPTPPQDTPTV